MDQFQRKLIAGLSDLVKVVKDLKGTSYGRGAGIEKLADKIEDLTDKIDDLSDNIRRMRNQQLYINPSHNGYIFHIFN